MKLRTILFLLAFLAAAMTPSLLWADPITYVWTGNAGDGLWLTDGNWNLSGFPNGADRRAIIDSNTGNNVTVTADPLSLNRVTVDQNDALVMRDATSGGQFTFFKNTTGTIESPKIINNGTINMVNTGVQPKTHIFTSGAYLTLDGTGTINLSANTGLSGAVGTGTSYGIINQAGHTVQGNGFISGVHVNYGTITAQNGTMLLGNNTTNYGSLNASPTGILEVQGGWLYGKPGGQINPNGGTVMLNGGTTGVRSYSNRFGAGQFPVIGHLDMYGTNRLDPGAVMTITDKTLSVTDNITNPEYQTAVIENNGEIRLNFTAGQGVYLNSGTIFAPQGTLTGNGRVILGGYASSYYGAQINGKFLNDVNHTIEGGGQITAAMTNNGTIIANNGRLEINAAMSGTGTIRAENGGHLYLTTGYNIPRTISTGDLILAQNSWLTVDGGSIYTNDGLLTVDVKGDFSIGLNDESRWSWIDNTLLRMSGLDRLHFLEVAGDSTGGLTGNFAIPKLEISGNLALVDLIDNGNRHSPEALFVESLNLLEGSTLNLNDLALYTMLSGELHLVTTEDIGIFGTGNIINQPVPLPGAVWLLGSGLLGLAGWRRIFKK